MSDIYTVSKVKVKELLNNEESECNIETNITISQRLFYKFPNIFHINLLEKLSVAFVSTN